MHASSPPRLTLRSGDEQIDAILGGGFLWDYTTHIGESFCTQADSFSVREVDYLSEGVPILRSEGPVRLEFGPVRLGSGPEAPDQCSLFVFPGCAFPRRRSS